ncbi:RICIN domain-containing protein [Streptomyces sp. NPDC005533]|uniref:RICIN domain-containing protein n=1 Tax=Streptomyces sp. NPDC005533 TaxID=3364723 RepID=UPI00369F160A
MLRHKKPHIASVVANRSLAVVLSMGIAGTGLLAGAAASSAADTPAGFNCFTSWEGPQTGYDWVNGKSDGQILRLFNLPTSFLDWANAPQGSKDTVQVNVQNSTSQGDIYVLSQTKLLFALADMAAATASVTTGVPSGWEYFQGMAEEAQIRSAVRALKDFRKEAASAVAAVSNKTWTAKEIADGTRDKEMLEKLQPLLTLNGDISTIVNGAADLFGRMKEDTTQTALDKTTPFGEKLIAAIKKQGIKVSKGKKSNIKSADYYEAINTWAVSMGINIARGLSGDARSIANMILGGINVFGVSGWASRLGFAPIDMFIMRDDLYGSRMSVNDNHSWIAQDQKLVPAIDAGGANNDGADINQAYGDLRVREGVGYYKWRNLTQATDLVDDQTLNHMTCNALQSVGFDGKDAMTAVEGIKQGLINAGFTGATWQDAAKVAFEPNFLKLLKLEYRNYAKNNPKIYLNNPSYALSETAKKTVKDVVAVAGTDWKTNPAVKLESAAKKGLANGSRTDGFAAYSQDFSNEFEASVSGAAFGVSYWHTYDLLKEMAADFDFTAEGDVWKAAQPKTDGTPSEYVRIAAFLLAITKPHSDGTPDVEAAKAEIDTLATHFGGIPGQVKPSVERLNDWWHSGKGDVLKSMPMPGSVIGHKIKLTSALAPPDSYCLNGADNGNWTDGAGMKIIDWYCDFDRNNNNTAERWTFNTNGQLQAMQSDDGSGTVYCLTASTTKSAPSTTSDHSVVLKTCNSSATAAAATLHGQQWRRYTDGTIHLFTDNSKTLIGAASPGASTDSGICLAASNAHPVGDTDVVTKPCDNKDDAQKWTFGPYVSPSITVNSVKGTTSTGIVKVNITYTCGSATKIVVPLWNNWSVPAGTTTVTPNCDGKPQTTTVSIQSRSGETVFGQAEMYDSDGKLSKLGSRVSVTWQ